MLRVIAELGHIIRMASRPIIRALDRAASAYDHMLNADDQSENWLERRRQRWLAQYKKAMAALANVEVHVDINWGQFRRDVAAFNAKVTNLAQSEFKNICIQLENDTIENTPVDTGRLRAGWNGEFIPNGGNDLAFLLYNNVEYALFVEEGTPHMKPRRMLARAIQRVANSR